MDCHLIGDLKGGQTLFLERRGNVLEESSLFWLAPDRLPALVWLRHDAHTTLLAGLHKDAARSNALDL